MPIINKKSLATVAGLSSIFLAITINGALSANQQKTPPPKVAPQYPVVSVTAVAAISPVSYTHLTLPTIYPV